MKPYMRYFEIVDSHFEFLNDGAHALEIRNPELFMKLVKVESLEALKELIGLREASLADMMNQLVDEGDMHPGFKFWDINLFYFTIINFGGIFRDNW